MVAADPLADYVQSCVAPIREHRSAVAHPSNEETQGLIDAGYAVAEVACSALATRLSAVARPTPEQRLALIKARGSLGSSDSEEVRCDEIRSISADLPDHPEVLYQLALCIGDDIGGKIALLRRALEIDPNNRNALYFLTLLVWHTGDNHGIDAATLVRHGTALYEISEVVDKKLVAARRVYAVAFAAGDRDAAAAIRARARRELGLDALDFGPERRAGSLERACGGLLFDLDLEDICLSAVEKLAGAAAAAGEPMPGDVLRHADNAFPPFRWGHWRTGPKTAAAARLRAMLESWPESQRSSEHRRVLAKTAPVWAERIEGLRRAVEMDHGNLEARCDLADGLALTGAREEAAALYAELLPADPWPACDPDRELGKLERQALRRAEPYAAPDDPVEFMILN